MKYFNENYPFGQKLFPRCPKCKKPVTTSLEMNFLTKAGECLRCNSWRAN